MSRQKGSSPVLTPVLKPAELLAWERRALAALRSCSPEAREFQIDVSQRLGEAEALEAARMPTRPALRLISGGRT